MLIVLFLFTGITACDNKIYEETAKATLKNLTEQANTVFNLFYNPMDCDPIEYDSTKTIIIITDENNNVFYPVATNDSYKSFADIKARCESVFTVEYCTENLYDIGFNGSPTEAPVYMEQADILYVNSSITRSSLEMAFDYNTINITKQTDNEITVNMDVFDYNFYPRVQAMIKMAKVDGNWRISFLFD